LKKTFEHLPEEKKKQIINACILEFGEHGFERTTTDALVKRMGISKGGLYEYISSKRELFLFTVEYTYDRLYGYIRKKISGSAESFPSDILDRVYIVSRYAIDFYMDHPEFVSLIVKTYQLSDDDLSLSVEEIFSRQYLDIFGDTESERLRFEKSRIIDMLMWLLLKTRYDFLMEMKSGKDPEEIKSDYMNNWEFYISVLKNGIYDK